MRREAFAAPADLTVEIDNAAGAIEVETGEVDEAVVELEPLSGEESVRAVQEATVELRGSKLVVDVERRKVFGLSLSSGRDVRVAVRVPRGAAVVAAAASADVSLDGEYRDVDVKTASGDVRVERVVGTARVKTASGDAAVESVGGDAQVQSASGDVGVGEIRGDARVQTASGDVRLGAARASVSVQSASGDQQIESVERGRADLKSASGDIVVGVRPGTRAWLDVRSISGDAESELDVDDVPADDEGPLVEIAAMSMSGDIRIVRATSVST